MKYPSITIRVTPEEHLSWTKSALDAGLSLSSWIKVRCNQGYAKIAEIADVPDMAQTASEQLFQQLNQPSPPKLCYKCERLGARPNCPDCAAL